MSNLNTFHTLHERVKKYQLDFKIETIGQAFDWVALETILNLSEDEIEDAITDGEMDGGIDAIHIMDRDVHIFNFKYTDNFELSKKNFPGTEVPKLLTTLDGIMNKSIDRKTVNQAVYEKAEEVWDLLSKGGGAVNLKVYFCSNKEKLNQADRIILEQQLNKYRFVEYFYYDQEDLVNKLLENKFQKIDGEINFIDKDYFDRSDGSLKAIVATVSATDLINLVEDKEHPEKINESAFDDNCRIYLKLKNPINQNIYDTALSDENYKFFYLNNGVTIVCDKCDYTPNSRSPRASLKNLQIVNGGQTTRALFEAYQKDKEKIQDVLVLVRICETNDRKLTEKISETTNSQTPVSNRDLRANDIIQKSLEEQFEQIGYFYERKKNLYLDESKELRLDNELLGQLYLAYYSNLPSEAKNQKSKVFGDRYELIFNEDEINAERMLLPYKLYLPFEQKKREIQSRKRKKEMVGENETFISHATFHLVNAVKFIAEGEGWDLNKPKNFKDSIEKAILYIEELVEEERKVVDEYNHNRLFKDSSTNGKIKNHIESKYAEKSV